MNDRRSDYDKRSDDGPERANPNVEASTGAHAAGMCAVGHS
jgi:hypothetical protein